MTATKQAEALQLLIRDHKKVKSLYSRFQKLEEDGDAEKQEIIEQVCQMLTAHVKLEEELFYPALRGRIDDPALLAEAYVEHDEAKGLIARLQSEELDGEERDAVFTVLCEYVDHHVQEEEKELFPKVRKADVDLKALGAEMAERKAELAEELGIDEEDGDAKGDETKGASRKK